MAIAGRLKRTHLKEEDKRKGTGAEDPKSEGKPSGKRGRLVPAGTLGRGKATVMPIGPAQAQAIKRRREKKRRAGGQEGDSEKERRE